MNGSMILGLIFLYYVVYKPAFGFCVTPWKRWCYWTVAGLITITLCSIGDFTWAHLSAAMAGYMLWILFFEWRRHRREKRDAVESARQYLLTSPSREHNKNEVNVYSKASTVWDKCNYDRLEPQPPPIPDSLRR
jgi:hypothetical protein